LINLQLPSSLPACLGVKVKFQGLILGRWRIVMLFLAEILYFLFGKYGLSWREMMICNMMMGIGRGGMETFPESSYLSNASPQSPLPVFPRPFSNLPLPSLAVSHSSTPDFSFIVKRSIVELGVFCRSCLNPLCK